jgi:hypothetical protein
MKAASSPVMAIPSIPLGRCWEIRMGTALLSCRSPVLAPSPLTVTAAISPGTTTTSSNRMTRAMANRLTPAISTVATAKLNELSTRVGSLKRSRRYSGTLRTFEL